MKPTHTFLVGMIFLTGVLVPGVEGARAEAFADVYIGAAFTIDTTQEFESPAVSGFGSEKFYNSVLPGGRVGYWIDALPWLGFAADVSYFTAKEKVKPTEIDKFELELLPVSALLMVRYPLLKGAGFPRGQVYPYLAAGPGFFMMSARVDTIKWYDSLQLGATDNFEDTGFEVGADVRAGIKLFHPTQNWGFFTEYRFTHVGSTSFSDSVNGMPAEAKFGPLNTHAFAFGVGYNF